MKIVINANSIIDNLIQEIYEIQTRYEKIQKGEYIDGNSEYRRIYDNATEAESKFNFAGDLLRINTYALYATVLAAKRWYERTEWQLALSEETANKLLECMIEQNDRDAIYERRGGNDYLLYWNKIILRWAKKSMDKKTVE